MRFSLTIFLRNSVFAFVLFFSALIMHAKGNPTLDTIDTPTAATLYKGAFDISVWGYNNGGIFTKAIMGVHDNIFLGVSFDVQSVIGSEPMVFNIPGVVARIKITDGWENFPLLIAIGYDAFYTNEATVISSESWKTLRMVYGPYVVFTKPVFLLESEQHINLGVRVPVQPAFNGDDTSLFLSFDFPIGQFVPMIELERVFFSASRLGEILFNVGIRFELTEDFAFELNLLMGVDKPISRIVTFEYVGAF